MDEHKGKNSKTARKKLRKKLLDSETKVDFSKVSFLSSDNTLLNENSMKELTKNEKQNLSMRKRKGKHISEGDVGKVDQLDAQDKGFSKKPKSEKSIESKGEKAKSKLLRENRLKQNASEADVTGIDQLAAECQAEKSLEDNYEKKKSTQRNRDKCRVNGPDVDGIDQFDAEGDGSQKMDSKMLIEGTGKKAKSKLLRKNRLKQKLSGADATGQFDAECEAEKSLEGTQEKKKKKLSQKNREKRNIIGTDVDGIDQLDAEGEDGSEKHNCRNSALELNQSETTRTKNAARHQKADLSLNKRTSKSEKSNKKKNGDKILSGKVSDLIKEETGSGASEVYRISSVDADSSKGMKKWINEYYQHRPGLEILQQRIDEFITTHEENEEQARKDKEALAADGGWTVVVHQKGRKKTTDAESGTVVGSVAQAAVVGHRSQKKIKDFGVDFYRFQKREAQRNEIMVLQSKFEEDKKRIQQLRSARKFRPY